MSADSSTFVAGHYTAAFTGGAENSGTALDIGTTEVGFELRPQFYREDIRIDDYGDTVVDGIFRGVNVFLRFELVKWVSGIERVLWPQSGSTTNPHTYHGDMGAHIGKTWQHLAGSLVLTPVADINSNLKTFTFHKVLPDGEHGAFSFNSRLRRMSCSFLCLPNISSSTTADRTKIFSVS